MIFVFKLRENNRHCFFLQHAGKQVVKEAVGFLIFFVLFCKRRYDKLFVQPEMIDGKVIIIF